MLAPGVAIRVDVERSNVDLRPAIFGEERTEAKKNKWSRVRFIARS